jgi:pimeloyl-ACP methyl ester carboxylesterase
MKSHYLLLSLLASFVVGMPEAQATLKKTCFTIKILRHPIRICLPIPEPRRCDKEPTGVAEEDIFLDVVTENMPDPTLDGQMVQMRVHRVKPVYAHGKCSSVRNEAIVMVHGRSAPGSPSFDLRLTPTEEDPDGSRISAQVALAWEGIDTFAPDLLGYGLSWRGPLDDPCNASLPACVNLNGDGTCPANAPHAVVNTAGFTECSPVAVGCDRTRVPVFPVNQQANRPVGLGVNPGLPLCAHSSPYHFANPDVFASNILQTIDFVIDEARPKGGKVTLLGYSFGGPSTSRALYLLGDHAHRKVKRVVLVNSLFNLFPGAPGTPPVVTNLPTEEEDLSPAEKSTSFPLSLAGLGSWTGVGAREAQCTGRVTPEVINAFWDQIMELDPLGDTWGGTVPNVYDENGELLVNNSSGLLRSPTFTRNGWNTEVAATFTLPTLLLHAADDNVALPGNADNMFNALTSVENKVLVKVDCSSHQFIGEACSGARCDDQDPNTTPYGQVPEDQAWMGPHHTIAAALIEWIKDGKFNDSKCGQFAVNPSGIVTAVPTDHCPAP